jgi:competence protein ComER
MSRYGFIGTGSMGSMLVRKFISTGTVAAADIAASSRTGISARALAEKTGITAAPSNTAAIAGADVIFLCVKPAEVKGVLLEIRGVLEPGTLLVSIAGSVDLAHVEAWAGGHMRTVRVIPSIVAEQEAGVSLVTFGHGVTPEDQALVLSLFNAIGTAVETDETSLDTCTDLTSCGPAFIAVMMREFAAGAVRTGTVKPALAEYLVRETLAGTAKILKDEKTSFETIVARVSTKGGTTEEGVKVLEARLPAVFDEVRHATREKRRRTAERVQG